MTRRKKCLYACLFAALLCLGGLTLLICTPSGLHLLLNGAARWVPGLQLGTITGGWRNLAITDIGWRSAGVDLTVARLHFSLRPRCLTSASLCVEDLTLSGVNLQIDSSKTATSPHNENSTQKALNSPVPITLRHLNLDNLQINIDGTSLSLARLSTGADWQNSTLSLLPTHIDTLLITLPTATNRVNRSAASQQRPLGERLQTLFSQPLLAPTTPIFFPLTIHLPQITGQQIRVVASQATLIKQIKIRGDILPERLQLAALEMDSDRGTLRANVDLALTGAWPLTANIHGTLQAAGKAIETVNIAVRGALQQQTTLDMRLAGRITAQLRASAQLATAGLPFDLTLSSPRLQWPLSGTADYQSSEVSMRIKGKATDYRLAMQGKIQAKQRPVTELRLNGTGTAQQFTLDALRLLAPTGEARLTGTVDWRQALTWQSALTLNQFDTGVLYAALPTRLNGSIAATGHIGDNGWQIALPQLNVTGNIQQHAVNLTGSITGNSRYQWDIAALKLLLGTNRLEANGKIADNIDLHIALDAPRLQGIWPGLAGRAKGTVAARGTLHKPQLQANLTAQQLRWQQIHIGGLALLSAIQADKQIQGNAALNIEQLQWAPGKTAALKLTLAGSEQQHQLALQLSGEPIAGTLRLNGRFDRQTQHWSGDLSTTPFSSPLGQWQLTRNIALDYHHPQQRITLSPHCWQNSGLRLCLPEPAVIGPSGQIRLALERFDTAILAPLLPAETRLRGVLTGNTRLQWHAQGGIPQGQLSLTSSDLALQQYMQGIWLPLQLSQLNINAALNHNQVQLSWLIRLLDAGQSTGKVQINDAANKRQLQGNLVLSRLSLKLLAPLLAQGEAVDGEVNAQLRLAGNLARPQLFGNLDLERAGIRSQSLPITVTAAQLGIQFQGTRSVLNGNIATSQGTLTLSGGADWRQVDHWRANVRAQGERIRVALPPEIKMDISPDLSIEATPVALNLQGKADIPWARINIEKVPQSATGVSADETLLDRHLQPIKQQKAAIPINSDFVIRLGNDVRLNAFDLKTQLTGQVNVTQDKLGLGLHGQINMVKGRFHAWGQDLLVRKGELQFSGPPEQPYINMEAIRNPTATEDRVIAGVRVTGLVDEPKTEIFSNPALSQQEALSYLLRGQKLEEGDNNNALTSALLGLGIAQSGQFVDKIGKIFGVSNLALDTAGVGNSQQIQVSGYVLPGLQVKYGVGLFDSLATLTLRYRVVPKLYLEAASGANQALDLLYQFEF